MTFDYQLQHSLEDRKKESSRVLKKNPNHVPVIVERSKNSDNVPAITKTKFLANRDATMGEFLHVIRKMVNIRPEQAIFIFINNNLPTHSALISEVYNEFADEDGFLYIEYTGENTFG
jgi:GABA(A) receptor-associated protein